MSFNLREYLECFGYVEKGSDAEIPSAAIEAAQAMYGLPETGVADEMTMRVLGRTPRCGVADVQHAREAINYWGITKLTYCLATVPTNSQLTAQKSAQLIRAAFDSWEAVCGLKFTQVNDSGANLYISSGRGSRAGFDGPSGTLAYAYLPPSAQFRGQLRMYFDLDEAWSASVNAPYIGLQPVGAHEIGHLIGFEHDSTPQQLMNPYYNPRIIGPQANDIRRAQAGYGKPVIPQPPTPPATPPSLPGQYMEVLFRFDGDDAKKFGPVKVDLSQANLTESL